ncbi:hypothetical protein [Dactylosporangium cerinum]
MLQVDARAGAGDAWQACEDLQQRGALWPLEVPDADPLEHRGGDVLSCVLPEARSVDAGQVEGEDNEVVVAGDARVDLPVVRDRRCQRGRDVGLIAADTAVSCGLQQCRRAGVPACRVAARRGRRRR